MLIEYTEVSIEQNKAFGILISLVRSPLENNTLHIRKSTPLPIPITHRQTSLQTLKPQAPCTAQKAAVRTSFPPQRNSSQ